MKKIIYGLEELESEGIYAISIVNMPAIEADFIALSKNQRLTLKVDNERRMLYGPILIPDIEIPRVDKNTGEEYTIQFPKETIEAAVHLFMKNKHQKDHTYEHKFAIDGLTVVEIWIKEGDSDKSVHLGMDYPVGSAFVGVKVDNDDAWVKVKNGDVKGFSIEGEFTQLSKDAQIVLELEYLLRTQTTKK
jgi:hypothetical protein